MKLEDIREAYYEYTKKTSENIRQLGYAGIAVIWVFKSEVSGVQKIPSELLLPAILIVTSLAFDLLQSVYGSLAWGIYSRRKEKSNISEDDEFKAPPEINWATIVFFWTKIISMILAYTLIIIFLISRFTG